MYKFKYTIQNTDEYKMISIEWKLDDFEQSKNLQVKRICSSKDEDYTNDCDDDLKFEVMLKFFGARNDWFELYYSSPESLFLKCLLNVNSTVRATDYGWVPAKQWQWVYGETTEFIRSLNSTFTFFVYNSKPLNNEGESYNKPKNNICHDLKMLQINPTLSDVILKSTDGVEIPAHKSVLVARSSVFKAHFEHEMKECLINVVESPFETNILQELVHYIYTDESPKLDEMPEKLLQAADFYHLDGLKYLCEKALYKTLSIDKAIVILKFADMHSAINLKRLTLKFIAEVNFEEIIKTEFWQELQSVELLKALCKAIYNTKCE